MISFYIHIPTYLEMALFWDFPNVENFKNFEKLIDTIWILIINLLLLDTLREITYSLQKCTTRAVIAGIWAELWPNGMQTWNHPFEGVCPISSWLSRAPGSNTPFVSFPFFHLINWRWWWVCRVITILEFQSIVLFFFCFDKF